MLDVMPIVSYYCHMAPSPTNGDAIKELRIAKGWRATRLAERLGISRYYLSNIERGERNGSPEVLHAIATLLEVPPIALTDGGTDAFRAALHDAMHRVPTTVGGAE